MLTTAKITRPKNRNINASKEILKSIQKELQIFQNHIKENIKKEFYIQPAFFSYFDNKNGHDFILRYIIARYCCDIKEEKDMRCAKRVFLYRCELYCIDHQELQ